MTGRVDEETLTFEVEPHEAGEPLLSLLGERLPEATTASLRELIDAGEVLLNGRRCGPRQALAAGDAVELRGLDLLERVAPERLAGLELLHAERDLLVVAKPAGVSVETERGQDDRPFRAGLLHLLRQLGRAGERPRVAHRLDKETSGALIVATTRHGLTEITRQLESHTLEKTYLALVLGVPRDDEGVVELPLHTSRSDEPQPATTRWRVVERFRRHALVEARPVTGRLHQVRIHLATLGHPLLVDPEHGGGQALYLSRLKGRGYRRPKDHEERPIIDRLTLHARSVRFASPADGTPTTVEAPLPRDLEVALRQLRRWDA